MYNAATLRLGAKALALVAALSMGTAWAIPPSVTEPAGINLGGTSFFDGFTGKPGTFAYLGYLRLSHANKILDNSGNESPEFTRPRINAQVYISQFAYTFTHPTLGTAHLGVTVLIPVVHFNTSFGSTSPVKLKNSGGGLGDLTWGLYLQLAPVMRDHRPVFSQRVEFDLITPVGTYDPQADINPSSGFTSVNPYWAATWLPTPKWSVSWRLHWLYNFTNHAPNSSVPRALLTDPATGGPVYDTQAGQASWVNFTTAYEVAPKWHVGINGYYFRQLTDNQVNGHTLNGNKEQVLGIGPGAFWAYSHKNLFMFNLYTETAVKNRPKNQYIVNLHWIHNF